MYRQAIEDLRAWRDHSKRKPLLITGARQVGKTWLMREFGRECFDGVAYVSFDTNPSFNAGLEETIDPYEIITLLQAATETTITPKTLIIFDEIQESPKALLSLKYFCEEAPQFPIMAAGSTLGVTLHNRASFPVGKVQFMNIHPMTFLEFLTALGHHEMVSFIEQQDFARYRPFQDKLIRLLKQYLYVGGMPAAVDEYASSGSFAAVREIQDDIVRSYDRDFSKYAVGTFSAKLRLLWNSAPAQLARENRKFIYSAVRKGARAREFEEAIQWMCDSSLVAKVNRVSVPRHPLKVYEDMDAFKMFLNDVGLLGAMVELNSTRIADPTDIFVEFKGALAEQFVFQELRAANRRSIYYWSKDSSTAEIDFLVEDATGQAVAIEVKSGINLRSKSLKSYMDSFTPHYAIRTSLADFKTDPVNRIIDVPLWAVSQVSRILDAPQAFTQVLTIAT